MKEFRLIAKYDLVQKVVGFNTSAMKLYEFEIKRISFDVTDESVEVWYHGDDVIFMEKNVALSRKDFIDSL